MEREETAMSYATKPHGRRCRRSRHVDVRHRGRTAALELRVEVRCDTLAAAEADRLARLALLQRLEHVRRKLHALRRLHERGVADGFDPMC